MIDDNQDVDVLLGTALSEPPAADEGEMTSIMGDEERRFLQRAARQGIPTASSPEEHLKDTARPPSSAAEPQVVIPPMSSVEPAQATLASAPERRAVSLMPILAFLSLCAAAWFAVRG